MVPLSSLALLRNAARSPPPPCRSGTLQILLSEVGDKTFFIAMVLAMRHSRLIVLAGALGALWVMTALSAAMGKVAKELVRCVLKRSS